MRIKHNGQWAMTIHSVTLVLSKITVLLQTLLGTHPITLYSERTVTHTHVSMILYFILPKFGVAQRQETQQL